MQAAYQRPFRKSDDDNVWKFFTKRSDIISESKRMLAGRVISRRFPMAVADFNPIDVRDDDDVDVVYINRALSCVRQCVDVYSIYIYSAIE